VDDQVPFKFTGTISKLTMALGPEQLTPPKRRWSPGRTATSNRCRGRYRLRNAAATFAPTSHLPVSSTSPPPFRNDGFPVMFEVMGAACLLGLGLMAVDTARSGSRMAGWAAGAAGRERGA